MAINNWRYVVTWGYMDENGNIVEERQYVPEATTTVAPWTNVPQTNVAQPINGTAVSASYFPTAEAYGLQAQWYANQWDNAMANAYGSIANDLGRYSTFANTTLWAADNLLNYIRNNETGLQSVAGNIYNNLVWDIQSQRNYINETFWPNGTLTQEVNRYYDDLGNYLASDAWRQAANIAAQWMHSWASLWAIRAQQNEAYNESFGRYVQAKEQEINAKQQIASNLINYMSALRQEYWDTTNQYVIDLYKRANDMYNNIAQSVYQDINQYNQLRMYWTGGSGGSSNSTENVTTPQPDPLNTENREVVTLDNQWRAIKTTLDKNGNAVSQVQVWTWYWPYKNFYDYWRNVTTRSVNSNNNSGNSTNLVVK